MTNNFFQEYQAIGTYCTTISSKSFKLGGDWTEKERVAFNLFFVPYRVATLNVSLQAA